MVVREILARVSLTPHETRAPDSISMRKVLVLFSLSTSNYGKDKKHGKAH